MVESIDQVSPPATWPWWRKIIFRFFFIYLVFQTLPWLHLNDIPGVGFIARLYGKVISWAVHLANDKVFHVRPVLVEPNGSGDTSYCWAELWLCLSIAVIGCIIWSVLDRKRDNYTKLNYWLCLIARYYLVIVAFAYGIIKIFCWQMVFPSLHQLATPLGDLLPMRLSWLFIGYSSPYQIFSGVMEVFAGSLLLYRRTATLGAFVATGVFINVMMLNLCYDIPVKIFSMQLVFVSLFLLANESKRLICFFILNRPADTCSIYHFNYSKKWMKVTRYILKSVLILLIVVIPFGKGLFSLIPDFRITKAKQPIFKNGFYEVSDYSVGKRNAPLAFADTMRWKNIVLENGGGSVETGDTTFKKRYNRHYFGYTFNEMQRTVSFVRKMPNNIDSALITMRYTKPDSNTIKLWGTHGKDSLFVELKLTKRHFQLAERQFHWLSEHNR